MAISKRKELGRKYPLKGVPSAGDEDIQKVKEILSKYVDRDLIQ